MALWCLRVGITCAGGIVAIMAVAIALTKHHPNSGHRL
ncbi:hypothetical protein PALB_36080 [Pseudoalteromonas luteoviolacea B = ATCC 29581]|nr:hypothetical protein PALB_36080 [Pseudoalteromonas luteoviolacea B = ATCC 29581]